MTHDEDVRESAQRLARDGGVFFARAGRPRPYFARVYRYPPAGPTYFEVLVEVLFNPEFVEFDGRMSDLLVEQGTLSEITDWLSALLTELDAEPCPAELGERAIEELFGVGSVDVQDIDGHDPWRALRQ